MRGAARRWAALFLAVPALAGAARGDEPKGARWVGPEALIYAEAARPEALLDRAYDPRVTNLLNTVPSYKQAMARPDVAGGKAVAFLIAAGLGTTPEKGVRDLLGGGVVAAVEGKDKPDRIFAVVTPKDAKFLENAHARILDFARRDAKNKKKPDPVAESDHRGVKLYSVAPMEAHAIVSGALVVANGTETLKTIIDRSMDPKTPTIADDPTFMARRSERDPEALAWAFARTDRLRAIDPKRFGGGDNKPEAGAIFLLGPWLEAAQKGDWACASLTWTDARLGAQLVVAEPKGGYSPAMKRYLPPKGEGAPRPSIPANAVAFGTLWRDVASIWEVRAEIFPPETVQGLAQLDTTAGTFFGGRDFGTGVLGALEPRWTIVVADQDFDAMDPSPDVKFPAVALVLDLKPDDPEFAIRLMTGFQSFLGLINLGSAETKAPPLMIGSDTVDGLSIATSKYLPDPTRSAEGPVDARFNVSPSAVQVGDQFVLSSSLGLARELARSLKEPAKATDSTLLVEADGAAISRLLGRNRARLVMQNMLEKGNAKDQAEGEIGLLLDLLTYLGKGRMTAEDRPGSATLTVDFALDASTTKGK